MPELRCLTLDGHALDIRPAGARRDWMDATPHRLAYRCLPLTLANACSWELLVSEDFTAVWTGEDKIDAVLLSDTQGTSAISHFGAGILTFHVIALFRTEGRTSLTVRGPIFAPRDGIAPLGAIVETWWSPSTFTMNWKFTRPHVPVTFRKGEPFCHLVPIDVPAIAGLDPVRRPLSSEPGTKAKLDRWTASRNTFNETLKTADPETLEEHWQKHYSQGRDVDGDAPDMGHMTKLRLRGFEPRGRPRVLSTSPARRTGRTPRPW